MGSPEDSPLAMQIASVVGCYYQSSSQLRENLFGERGLYTMKKVQV